MPVFKNFFSRFTNHHKEKEKADALYASSSLQEKRKGIVLYLRAAKNKNASALESLSEIEMKAGNQDEAVYYKALSYIIRKEWDEGFQELIRAVQRQYPPVFFELAKICLKDRIENGICTVPQNLDLAFQYFAEVAYLLQDISCLLSLSRLYPKADLTIGFLYQDGKINKSVNITEAIRYYQYAANRGELEANRRLGRLYQEGHVDALEANLPKSFDYYLPLASQNDVEVLKALDILEEKINDDRYTLTLALTHRNLSSHSKAITYFKSLVNKGNQEAVNHLNAMAEQAELAYQIAESYKLENLNIAYSYYLKAALKNHADALKFLDVKAVCGDQEAQYTLGVYYCKIDYFIRGVTYYLEACQNAHQGARHSLFNGVFNIDIYLFIAQTYEKGSEKITANQESALIFYNKAYEKRDKTAALSLAYFHQKRLEMGDPNESPDHVCEFFYMAALYGHPDALASIERIAEDVTPGMQVKIGDLYSNSLFKNDVKARKWYKKAMEEGDKMAAQKFKKF